MKNKNKIVIAMIIPFIWLTSTQITSASYDYSTMDWESIKTVFEKQRNNETLTTDEQATLDTIETNRPQMWSWTKFENNKQKNIKGNNYWNLSNTYKTKIDTAMDKIIGNIVSYSTEDKLATLNTLKTKITTTRSNIENSTYSDSKKITYNNILDYLLNRINTEIDNLWSNSDGVDNLLNSIFQ